jgi:hypothetical protein
VSERGFRSAVTARLEEPLGAVITTTDYQFLIPAEPG